jgi:hypothetical protein
MLLTYIWDKDGKTLQSFLCICALFSDAFFSNPIYIVSDEAMITE